MHNVIELRYLRAGEGFSWALPPILLFPIANKTSVDTVIGSPLQD